MFYKAKFYCNKARISKVVKTHFECIFYSQRWFNKCGIYPLNRVQLYPKQKCYLLHNIRQHPSQLENLRAHWTLLDIIHHHLLVHQFLNGYIIFYCACFNYTHLQVSLLHQLFFLLSFLATVASAADVAKISMRSGLINPAESKVWQCTSRR